MSDLIDRYVWAVSERLPDNLRRDVSDELRTTIADMAEARGGDDPATREVLRELGDPVVLAGSYAGRPAHLIGPRFYADYLTTLKVVSMVALPFVLVAQLIVEFWDADRALVPGVLAAVGGAVEVGIHIVFWTTLVFVVLERSGADPLDLPGRTRAWDPDALAAVPARRQITRADLVVGVGMLLTPVLLVVWQRFRPVVRDGDGDGVPVLDPGLWSLWIPLLFVLIAVNVALEVWKYRVGRWTFPVTAANLLLNVAWVTFIVTLVATVDVVNPQFTAEMRGGGSWNPDTPGIVAIAVAAVICIWDSADSIVKHRRVRSGELDVDARQSAHA